MSLATFFVATAELLNAAFGINEGVLTRVERVTLGARIDVHFLHGRTRVEYVSTTTCYRCVCVFWMNIGLHGSPVVQCVKRIGKYSSGRLECKCQMRGFVFAGIP